MYVCVYIYVYKHTHTSIHPSIHTYIHTYTVRDLSFLYLYPADERWWCDERRWCAVMAAYETFLGL
jgi:hypothetical protein